MCNPASIQPSVHAAHMHFKLAARPPASIYTRPTIAVVRPYNFYPYTNTIIRSACQYPLMPRIPSILQILAHSPSNNH